MKQTIGAIAMLGLSCILLVAHPLSARAVTVSPGIVAQARAMALACPSDWQTPACLKVVSESSLSLAARYDTALQQSGHAAAADRIKQHCAASTAAMQGTYPAAAMRSAFIECANIIGDVAEKTGVKPDASAYQLLVGPVLCLKGDPSCTAVEEGLKRFLGH